MKYAVVLSVAGLMAPILSASAVELSPDFNLLMTVGAYSEYNSRGLSQTQRDPALQAYATLLHSSGLYVGAWTSNVDFGGGLDVSQEIDYYGGYLWQPTEKISLDVGYIKYTYPKTSALNVSEKYAVLNAYGFLLGAYYSDDNVGDQTALYTYAGYKTILPLDTGFEVRYGKADLKDPMFFSNNGSSRDSYHEWEVKLSHAFVGLDWSVSYVDTDLSGSECASYLFYKDVCSARLVAGVSKSF